MDTKELEEKMHAWMKDHLKSIIVLEMKRSGRCVHFVINELLQSVVRTAIDIHQGKASEDLTIEGWESAALQALEVIAEINGEVDKQNVSH